MAPKKRGQYQCVDASYLIAGPVVVVAVGSVAPPPAPPQRVIFEARTPAQGDLFFEMMKDNTPSYQEYKRKKAEESDQEEPKKGSSRANKITSRSSGSSGYVPAPKQPPPGRDDPNVLEQQQRLERQQMSEQDDSKGNHEQLYGSVESEAMTDPWFRTNNNSSRSSAMVPWSAAGAIRNICIGK